MLVELNMFQILTEMIENCTNTKILHMLISVQLRHRMVVTEHVFI